MGDQTNQPVEDFTPPAGPLTIKIAREGDCYRIGLVSKHMWVTSEIVRPSGQGAGKDFHVALERLLSSLKSTRTVGRRNSTRLTFVPKTPITID